MWRPTIGRLGWVSSLKEGIGEQGQGKGGNLSEEEGMAWVT